MNRVEPHPPAPVPNHQPAENTFSSKITSIAIAIIAALSSFYYLPVEGALFVVGLAILGAVRFALMDTERATPPAPVQQ